MMAKKINGTAKWVVVAMAIGGFVFNSGILYNDVVHLTKAVDKLEKSYNSLDEKIDIVILRLSAGAENEKDLSGEDADNKT